MVDWQITRGGDTVETEVYDVDPLADTLNPSGDAVTFLVDDIQGTKFEQYSRGTQIEASVFPDGGALATIFVRASDTRVVSEDETDHGGPLEVAGEYRCAGETQVGDRGEEIEKLTGYVVESREREEQGADVLEVEAYSYDQFLRRDQVNQDLSGQLISEALERIIKDETPVAWNASKVDIGDDQPVTRPFQGETAETAIRDLSFASENEEFGVDDDLEFFFREREPGTVSRGIDNTEWISYDVPELGKDVVNEVEVWYDGGTDTVVVDDPNDKLDLQENLGLPDPGRQRDEIHRPGITEAVDAQTAGRSHLQVRNETLSGTVTTFGLFNASPGDTVDVTIDPRGIDAEFRVAAVEYRWLKDETELTIVENRDVTNAEVLFRLSEAVGRVEMRDADRGAVPDRVVTTQMGVNTAPTAAVDSAAADDARFVNDGRNKLREAWASRATIDSLTIVVGDDGSNLSRTNTGLENQTNSASASTSTPDATTVRYSASISESDVREVGIESDGTLLARFVFDDAQSISSVDIDLSVSNDADADRGVVTADGQTVVRDLLANNNPDTPAEFVVGTDDTAVNEGDTALGNQVESYPLDEQIVQAADTNSEWSDIV
jgi:hypothetical protein